MPDFKAALDLVLKYEGGRVDDPNDLGGRTAFGVTQATFDAHCKSCGVPHRDVWTITPAEVEAVYRAHYAAAIRFDDLPDGVGFVALDGAINSGPSRSAKWLQAALGVAADGQIGPGTLAAAKSASAFTLINAMCDTRLSFLRGLSGWGRYGHGWGSRVEDVRKNALAMARKAAATPASRTPELDLIRGAVAKAAAEQAKAPVPSVPTITPPAPVPDTYLPPAFVQHSVKPLQPEGVLQRLGAWFRGKASA